MRDDGNAFNSRAARAMRSAYEGEKNGALICEGRKVKRLVFFEQGRLVGARSTASSERLGAVLVREGRVSQAQLDEAARFIRSGRKLGQILVELDYLKGGEIEPFVRLQIIEIACAILVTAPDRLVFSERVPVEAVTLSPVTIGDVFLTAFKRLPDVALYRENLLVDDYVPVQTDDTLALVQGMKLSESEGHVLDLVDGRNSFGEILSRSPLTEDATARLLVALHQAGMLALKTKKVASKSPGGPRPASPPAGVDPLESELIRFYNDVQCQNHWQILGVKREATYVEIDRAYRQLTSRFEPEKYQHLPDSDLKEKLSLIRARLKEAFVTLSSQTSINVYDDLVKRQEQYEEKQQAWDVIQSKEQEPKPWERPKDSQEAKRLFVMAQAAFREKDFWQAIELCRSSIEMDDENHAERFHLLGRALQENPRWRKDAEKNLKIAQKLQPWEPRYLVSLGELYAKEGMLHRAERIFEQVKAIDPDYPIPKIEESSEPPSAKGQKAG